MTTKKQSVRSSGGSRRQSAKHSQLGRDIINGLEELRSHLRGETVLRTRTVYVPEAIDVRAVREKTGLSQSEFAQRFGFSIRTLQEWEQGRARPDSAVRAYLLVIDRNRTAVETALAG